MGLFVLTHEMQNAKCKIGIYLAVTTYYVILSEAALCAAKSKNPFSLRCFRGRILRLATLAQDDSGGRYLGAPI